MNHASFYDYENEAFHYYSDSKTHTFKALETVARKYVLDYDCKALYHDMDKELEELKEKAEAEAEAEKAEAEAEKAEAEKEEAEKEPDSVGWNPFANFRNYKIETKENNKPNINKKINKFKYLGRLEDYNKNNMEEKKQEFIEIDYNSFKKKNK